MDVIRGWRNLHNEKLHNLYHLLCSLEVSLVPASKCQVESLNPVLLLQELSKILGKNQQT
jgi:hypothetical protein